MTGSAKTSPERTSELSSSTTYELVIRGQLIKEDDTHTQRLSLISWCEGGRGDGEISTRCSNHVWENLNGLKTEAYTFCDIISNQNEFSVFFFC